jgi:hypothetical protein
MIAMHDNLVQVAIIKKQAEMMIIQQVRITQNEITISLHKVNAMLTFANEHPGNRGLGRLAQLDANRFRMFPEYFQPGNLWHPFFFPGMGLVRARARSSPMIPDDPQGGSNACHHDPGRASGTTNRTISLFREINHQRTGDAVGPLVQVEDTFSGFQGMLQSLRVIALAIAHGTKMIDVRHDVRSR